MGRIRVAVLASGRGTDFQSIIGGVNSGKVNAEIVGLVTDNPEAKAIERAKKNGIPFFTITRKSFSSRAEHDKAVKKKLDELEADLVVLAGYMRIIKDEEWLKEYKGKMINIHPSLLPAFPGAHAQEDAFEAGVKVSGYTIHFVDDSLDGGPVILQEEVDVGDCGTADELAQKILEREHEGLPKVVDSFSKGKYELKGGKVEFTPFESQKSV